jgi:hypothetical protein
MLGGQQYPDWALVNKQEIHSAIADSFEDEHPYPAELDNDYSARVAEQERLSQQISDLKSNATQRCLSMKSAPASADTPPRYPSPPQPLQREYVIRQAGSTAELQSCLQDIENDQLIRDLRAQTKAFQELQQQRREHDVAVRKLLDEQITAAIATYATANGFSLVISNESSIVYNQNQRVLDVTAAVIAQLQNPPPKQ